MFQDRKPAQGREKRRKLTIKDNKGNSALPVNSEIEVDFDYADSATVTGTPLNATELNNRLDAKLNKSGADDLTFGHNKKITMPLGHLEFNVPTVAIGNGWARGLIVKNGDFSSTVASFGYHGWDDGPVRKIFMSKTGNAAEWHNPQYCVMIDENNNVNCKTGAGGLQENGQRVYSPNNKPTAADIGVAPGSAVNWIQASVNRINSNITGEIECWYNPTMKLIALWMQDVNGFQVNALHQVVIGLPSGVINKHVRFIGRTVIDIGTRTTNVASVAINFTNGHLVFQTAGSDITVNTISYGW